MIRLLTPPSGERIISNGKVLQTVSLFADTKSEVTNSITGADVEGMDDDKDIDSGSIVRTASFEVAAMNSSHTWIWKS